MIENGAGWRYVQSTDSPADYPTVSEHNAGKFQDLKTNVAGKAPVSHTHTQSQVTGLDAALAGKAPLTHTHTQSQVTGLDAALAGKAPTTHTHTTAQVTGLDTALAGKATQTTLDTRVPAGLALRLDTTAGTRIFAGDNMIHGDTGWRDVTSYAGDLADPANTGSVSVRRTGNRVFWRFNNFLLLAGAGGLTLSVPSDLRIGWRPPAHWATQTVALYNDLSFTNNITHANNGGWFWINQFAEYTGTLSRTRPRKGLVGISDFTTLDPWPTSLPGLPA